MPRVTLTEKQRREARIAKRRKALAEGLGGYAVTHEMTSVGMAKELGICYHAYKKIVAGEPVQVDVSKLFYALELAGLEVRMVDKLA